MAIQQLDIAEWLLTIGDYIKKDEKIAAFCTEHFTEELKVQAGELLKSEEPKEEDCPGIQIFGAMKTEGLYQTECEYSCGIGVCISADSTTFKSTGGTVMHNGFDLISKLLTLIQEELNLYKPMAKVEASVAGVANPSGTFWIAGMDVTWIIEQTLGGPEPQKF